MRHRRLKTTEPTKNHSNFNNVMKQLATLLLVLVAFAKPRPPASIPCLQLHRIRECIYVDENGDLCVVEGCNIEGACNYDPEADLNDGVAISKAALAAQMRPPATLMRRPFTLTTLASTTSIATALVALDQDECGNCFAPL